jgi:hypothetical protein
MMSCSGQKIEERSFTYYDPIYGKFYLEIDRIVIDDLEDIVTLTMKYTATQAHTFILDTFDFGKAGMMRAELRHEDRVLYSSDDLSMRSEGGEVVFEINEKVFRNIQFSLTPFDDEIERLFFPSGEYRIWLYVDREFLVETDIIVTVDV